MVRAGRWSALHGSNDRSAARIFPNIRRQARSGAKKEREGASRARTTQAPRTPARNMARNVPDTRRGAAATLCIVGIGAFASRAGFKPATIGT